MREQLPIIWQTWRGVAERLRQRGALVSLAVLLSIGLLEPLVCIIHCAVQEALYSRQATVHQHHHHAGTSTAGSKAVSASLGDTSTSICAEDHQIAATSITNCDSPTPQPFHEMTLLAIFVLLPLALIVRRARDSTGPPAEFFPPKLLHPPLLCA